MNDFSLDQEHALIVNRSDMQSLSVCRLRLPPFRGVRLRLAIARKQAKRIASDRSRAGMVFSSGNGKGASKKTKWADFQDLDPMPELVVVR